LDDFAKLTDGELLRVRKHWSHEPPSEQAAARVAEIDREIVRRLAAGRQRLAQAVEEADSGA
jgi:histidinol-phosphate/aromatic aminotransferase/cobyric acid decarboxylase-like protein